MALAIVAAALATSSAFAYMSRIAGTYNPTSGVAGKYGAYGSSGGMIGGGDGMMGGNGYAYTAPSFKNWHSKSAAES